LAKFNTPTNSISGSTSKIYQTIIPFEAKQSRVKEFSFAWQHTYLIDSLNSGSFLPVSDSIFFFSLTAHNSSTPLHLIPASDNP
jgi:hypothetical protein